MTTTIQPDAIDEMIGRIDRLHSAPAVARRVLSLTRGTDFDMTAVVTCLERDPGLSARILRLVNSSRYGLRGRVSGIRHAASLLGQRSMRLFAVTFALVEALRGPETREIFGEYWLRARIVGSLSSELSHCARESVASETYTGGLLADVGELVLAQFEQQRYFPIRKQFPHGTDLAEAERREFGFDHAELGARLLEQWELPDDLVNGVRHHHQESACETPFGRSVFVANLVADALMNPQRITLPKAIDALEVHFGLKPDSLIKLASSCRDDLKNDASDMSDGPAWQVPIDDLKTALEWIDVKR